MQWLCVLLSACWFVALAQRSCLAVLHSVPPRLRPCSSLSMLYCLSLSSCHLCRLDLWCLKKKKKDQPSQAADFKAFIRHTNGLQIGLGWRGGSLFFWKSILAIGWTLYVQWQAGHTLVSNSVRVTKRMPPICIKEKAFILNATVDDAVFEVCAEESPTFFVVCCYNPKERAKERESMNVEQTVNTIMFHNASQYLLKCCN